MKHRITKPNEKSKTGICEVCGKVKIHIHIDKRYNNLKVYSCRKRINEKSRSYYSPKDRVRIYGVTVEYIDDIRSKQRGKCAICKKLMVGNKEHIDHCHKTGKVRGLLCSRCNIGLGYFSDDPELLTVAVNYLQKGKQKRTVTRKRRPVPVYS